MFSALVIEQTVVISSLSQTTEKIQNILAEISWAFNSEIPPSSITQLHEQRRHLLANSSARDLVKTVDHAVASFEKCTRFLSVGQDEKTIQVLGEDLQSVSESAKELQNDYEKINKRLLALHGRPNHSTSKKEGSPPSKDPEGGTNPLQNGASEHLGEKSKGGGSRDNPPPPAKGPHTRRMSCWPFNLRQRFAG